ncbi:dephospho-CoA kinase [Ekhidna sp.]|uniref:dephospho-CoA kinase n=1 Tax=Ekhidna sp. TaxID=2608089 RepID=UPI0032974F2A
MNSQPLIVGVTGGIGSGKSTVCKVFEILGAVTYYADDRAKWLMTNDGQLVSSIKRLFGDEAYENGRLDRQHIAGIAFKDQTMLEQLNQLVHPTVANDVEQWKKANKDAPILLKEAALLFETGSYKSLDKTILVTAPLEVRIQRVIRRDSYRSREDVRAIIDKQMSDEKKIPLADYTIVNDGKQSVIKQVMKLYSSLIA